jgi:hypothetical protein
MPDRAAIVTGASRGIGFALAEALGEEGFGLTITARKPDTLEQAPRDLRDKGFEVEHLAANMADEQAIEEVASRHRERYRRLDVLVNKAGVGIGAPATEHETKYVDMQLDSSRARCPRRRCCARATSPRRSASWCESRRPAWSRSSFSSAQARRSDTLTRGRSLSG